MDKASEVLYQLKPVTFRFKKGLENLSPVLDYGLIAEDVAKIDPKLAVRDGKGQIESVRYMAIYNMMLNEFLKEHQKVEEQHATIAELKSTVAQQQKGMEVLTAQLKEQASQIQKVSAQVEMSRPAPQMVGNSQ
jgi:septal ring factor EnvC (AmiA/AmiB activator)